MGISVAIVGAGPAGFYAAEALLDRAAGITIDILERLPTPYGLVRAGVAPDHQSTKQVSRKFEQTALDGRVRVYGNVEVGRDIDLDELRRLYDAVVLAVGVAVDRPLGIPGESLQGVYGATSFVGWYNGHPDYCDLAPRLARRVAVIGNGNVALDVARILVRSRGEMATSDIPEYAMAAIERAEISDVYLIGRRGPREVKFSPAELREAGRLGDAAALVQSADLAAAAGGQDGIRGGRGEDKLLGMFREFAGNRPDDRRRRLHFRFFRAPAEVIGTDRVEALLTERTRIENGRALGTGAYERFDVGVVIYAIGYRASPLPGLPFDPERGIIPNDDGRIAPGLYSVGWAKRGATGVIGSNRPDGLVCAEQIGADVAASSKPGRAGFERLLHKRKVRFVSFADWQMIDEAEVAEAQRPAPRRKLTRWNEMLTILGKSAARRISGRG